MNRLSAMEVARRLIEERYPECEGALLAGSVVRGEGTVTSDLDIVVFDHRINESYRESFYFFDWPVELFCHNLHSYKHFFKQDCERGIPSLPRMVFEGVVIKDRGTITQIKKEAKELLTKGPKEWTTDTLNVKRYFITDMLEDFIGCEKREEGIFIAASLAEALGEFILRTNHRWMGKSKWIYRALKNYDEKLADQFFDAFNTYYKTGEKQSVIELVDQVLKPYGGRLFEGFSLGKD